MMMREARTARLRLVIRHDERERFLKTKQNRAETMPRAGLATVHR
jgi:hypothetical protein